MSGAQLMRVNQGDRNRHPAASLDKTSSREVGFCVEYPTRPGDAMPDPTSLLEIGARLAVTRKALGLTQAEMDRRMGSGLTNGQTFNFYETGRQRIPTHHALALCRTCNITLDWIYRGQMHSLQPDICAKIENELDRLP